MPIIIPIKVQVKTFAQTAGTSANPALVSVSFDTTPTIGNFVTVTMGTGGNLDATTITFSDNQASGGNTYSTDNVLIDHLAMNAGVGIGSAQITKSSGTFTVTASIVNTSLAPNYQWIAIQEWSGVVKSSAIDTSTSTDSHGVSSTSVDTGTTTTLKSAYDVVVAAHVHNNTSPFTDESAGTEPASGWTEEFKDTAADTYPGSCETVVTAATTGVSHIWTISSGRYVAVLMAYKGQLVQQDINDPVTVSENTDPVKMSLYIPLMKLS